MAGIDNINNNIYWGYKYAECLHKSQKLIENINYKKG